MELLGKARETRGKSKNRRTNRREMATSDPAGISYVSCFMSQKSRCNLKNGSSKTD